MIRTACGDSGPRTCEQSAQGLVAVGIAVIGNQVLPDGNGIPATSESLLDRLAVRFADTGCPILVASRRWNRLAKVGGHLAVPWPAGGSYRDPRGLLGKPGCFSTYTRCLLDAPPIRVRSRRQLL